MLDERRVSRMTPHVSIVYLWSLYNPDFHNRCDSNDGFKH